MEAIDEIRSEINASAIVGLVHVELVVCSGWGDGPDHGFRAVCLRARGTTDK